jgi:serine/threonine protein kinase
MATASQQRELLPGDLVGAFRIERTLGVGGFGITYLALDTGLNVQVAIKEYFPQNAWRDTGSRAVHCYTGGAEQTFQVGLQRFHKEGQTLAQFKHPNIVRVRQMLPANNTAYLVMDYEQGEELEAYLRRIGRPLSYQELENIFAPLLDGLRAVHDRGLLHLDIKPENIFLRADSTPVLIDFGGARHQLGQASRAVSFLVASDGYAPNEQYTGTQLQPTTDVYAVGATIYRCITGQVPADAPKRGVAMIDGNTDPLPPVRQCVSHGAYPEHFLQTLDDALNMRVSNRPQSVRELQQRLFHSIQTHPHPQPLYTPSSPLPMPVTTTSKTNWLPIALGVIAVLVAVFFWNMASKKTAEAQQQKIQAEQKMTEALQQKNQAEQQVQDAIQQKKQAEQQATLLSKTQEEISNQAPTAKGNDERAVLAVIDTYADISGENDPYAALKLYTEPMDYYSKKSASHDFIVKDSSHYVDVYATREFHVTSQPMLEWLSRDEVQATYNMSYTLCCKKDKDPVDGVNLMLVRLVRIGDNWKISAINSKKI